ncbi:MAG: asparagine synthase (glutamine-hydrolyzing) [Taibaiella sp.]|nr:asparagine synthase (glutamine-hydrolyzing) [Taibaiella sp.]
MCGIAGYIGRSKDNGLGFCKNAGVLLQHRGPDDTGIYNQEQVSLLHRRLSILELSELGHQPMTSSCGRYTIVFNGEIYNHLELRKRHLPTHTFRGHSDTETIIELFAQMQEKMLTEMVGMWAIIIWDNEAQRAFISRDRYGQKPLYVRKVADAWLLASEVKPLIGRGEQPTADPTAVVEYLALGNYGHLGAHTFFGDIKHFPQGSYCWLSNQDQTLTAHKYWYLPEIKEKEKRPFDEVAKKKLHDCIVEGVLSQTLADVPVGITLSGGIDSSIIAGVLSTYYDKDIHIFTAQAPGSRYDESKYVDAVIAMNKKGNFIVHRKNLDELSIKNDLSRYINIQEEPFGDPSIMAHGFLMKMAADAGIKVILNGQGADELFFGYNNMAQAILLQQMTSMKLGMFRENLKEMNLGRSYMLRIMLQFFSPGLEFILRNKSRVKRRGIIEPSLLNGVNNKLVSLYDYSIPYDVWRESIYGVHIPHLVHYDDRNGMANSIEGRMPFLDHRIAEHVATIRSSDFLKHGLRKYLLRESCKQYLPESVYSRTDKIGFYTPLIDALYRDEQWVTAQFKSRQTLTSAQSAALLAQLSAKTLTVPDALQIWRAASVNIWKDEFKVR